MALRPAAAKSAARNRLPYFIFEVYILQQFSTCQVIPWLTIAQLAEHLTVDEKSRYQSVLGSIPSGETATETCMTKIFFALSHVFSATKLLEMCF